ncbi:DUF2163 domain-containing protein [Consotaella aegiceratis]|uniref:DUF2163 domain-containing protein n=1 Tax=Consotaella aegiceratis TaxID=3097961 RepID=UPI002F418361
MRPVPASLAAHLAGQSTTLANCWRLSRRDGIVLGFTDHDEPLTFDGTTFEAATGLSAGEAETEIGLSAGTQEVEGALSSLAIDEADIRAGRYDGSRIETFAVNWLQPDDHLLVGVAELGEVKRDGTAFSAELRDITAALDRRRGRIYRRRCDAVFGDDRCGIDLTAAGLSIAAVVLEARGGWCRIGGLPDLEAEPFGYGHVAWTSGAAVGLRAAIASFTLGGEAGQAELALIDMPDVEIETGDQLTIFAGCDKSFATCRDRYANGLNFRGFPHLPGTDAALGIAKKDAVNDGSPVVP